MAHMHGVHHLCPQADQPVYTDMVFDLCIQCDEHIRSDNVEFLALLHPDPEHAGQHIYYLKVRLNGVCIGNRAPTIRQIRVVHPLRHPANYAAP